LLGPLDNEGVREFPSASVSFRRISMSTSLSSSVVA